MVSPRPFELPDVGHWQQINLVLDDLLALDGPEREARLNALVEEHPAWGDVLRRLLACAMDDQALDTALLSALGFLARSDALPAQRDFGPWRLKAPLGQGGMAQVFLAERADGAYEQRAAVKLMWPGLANPSEFARFQRERQLLASMDDPRIARLLDGGVTADGRPWLAMEYIRGCQISAWCTNKALSLSDRLHLFMEVAAAVGAAHRRLVVHGDLKPGNVMVTEDGAVRLLDFGVGRLLEDSPGPLATPIQGDDRSGRALTPRYASPEQRQGEPISTASDIFQLGKLLEELLAMEESLASGPPRELCAIIAQATADHPDDRYPSADALLADIQRFVQGYPVQAFSGGRIYRTRRFIQRHLPGVSALALMLALAVAALVIYVDQSRRVAAEAEVSASVLGFLERILHGGNPYLDLERPQVPVAVIEDAARRARVELSQQPRVQVRVLSVLGQVYLSRGQSVAALELLQQAEALARDRGLVRDATSVQALLAVAYAHTGLLTEGEDLLRTVLAERLDRFGTDNPVVVQTLLTLADLLHSRGAYEEAADLALQALDSGVFPAWSEREMGMIRRDQGRYVEAEGHLQRALVIERETLDPRHVNLAASLEHQAQLMLLLGRQQEADAALAEAFEIRQRNLGPDWSGLIWTRHWLGLAAFNRGDFALAEALLKRSLDDYAEAFSAASHLAAFASSDLGWLYLATQDLDAATRHFDHAAEVLTSTRLDGHPRLAEALLGLAAVAFLRSDPDAARSLAERALEQRRETFGAVDRQHPLIVAACLVYLASGGSCPEQAPLDAESLTFRRIQVLLAP